MAGDEKRDLVHRNAVHAERIRKEQRHQKLHTEFSVNPRRKLHVLPDKPMSRKPAERIAENSDFIEAFHKARQEPTKKYTMPQTESQEIGWVSAPLIQEMSFPRRVAGFSLRDKIASNRDDKRFNFYRFSTDVTKYKESALRSSS